jgi:hypothetical protein
LVGASATVNVLPATALTMYWLPLAIGAAPVTPVIVTMSPTTRLCASLVKKRFVEADTVVIGTIALVVSWSEALSLLRMRYCPFPCGLWRCRVRQAAAPHLVLGDDATGAVHVQVRGRDGLGRRLCRDLHAEGHGVGLAVVAHAHQLTIGRPDVRLLEATIPEVPEDGVVALVVARDRALHVLHAGHHVGRGAGAGRVVAAEAERLFGSLDKQPFTLRGMGPMAPGTPVGGQ